MSGSSAVAVNAYQQYDEAKFAEKLKDLTPDEQEAVRKFWRSLVLRSQRAFSEENGRVGTQSGPTSLLSSSTSSSAVRSCNCCPYGYHIDLDFVRYCESLAHAKPSEEELRRRDRRRSRKSMEFMLGFESLFEQWDADARVQSKLAEASHESEPDSPCPFPGAAVTQSSHGSSLSPPRPRSSSVPRFTYGGLTRSESPFGTASSTTSSALGGIVDSFPLPGHAANSPPETRAFLHDALDDVCSDFERTLERASVKRRQKVNGLSTSMGAGNGNDIYSLSDRNNNNLTNGYSSLYVTEKRHGQSTWDRYYDTTDSCVAANKSPRSSRLFTRSHTLPLQQRPTAAEVQYESYVKATVAANAKSPVEQLETTIATPPPPPPRRHHHYQKQQQQQQQHHLTPQKSIQSPGSIQSSSALSSSSSDAGVSQDLGQNVNQIGSNTSTDALTLYIIRQRMAFSLKRMKDLEEQVKTIPEMQSELDTLRAEKQRLQSTLQRKNEELVRQREVSTNVIHRGSSDSSSPSPKLASPVQFTPQRISPVSLESMGARLRTNSTSSERTLKSVLKRDVGTMCVGHTTRDIAVGSPILGTRAVGTNPKQQVELHELLYTQLELEQKIKVAISTHEEDRKVTQLQKLISVGTQMYVPKRDLRESSAQTQVEKPVVKYAVGVMAKPATRENYVTCKPSTRTVGSSDARVDDVLCEKCKTLKRSIACGTEEPVEKDQPKSASLKQLDAALPGRSNTFSLGDNEKLNIKRKTTATQYTPVTVHSAGSQTSQTLVHSVGIQFAPEMQAAGTQSVVEMKSRQTDTTELTRLRISEIKTEQIAPEVAVEKPIIKPQTCTTACNTMPPARTSEAGVNTRPQPPPVRTTHSASNTDQVHKRDVACGEIVKPHISIACAANYCDSCKDAIKNLAKDFTKSTLSSSTSALSTSLTRSSSSDSRIPRPKHLTSPSPVRKQFQRQNTYTVTSSPTTSMIMEKRKSENTLQEKPPSISSFQTLESSGETQNLISEPKASSSAKQTSSPAKQTSSPTRQTSGPAKQTSSPAKQTSSPAKQTSSPTKQTSSPAKQTSSSSKSQILSPKRTPGGSFDLSQLEDGELVVRQEKRVSISWSRDASPAPLPTSSTQQTSSPERQDDTSESSSSTSATYAAATADDISKGARKKSSTPLKSSQSEESQITVIERNITKPSTSSAEEDKQEVVLENPPSKALLQKLAMCESKPREKTQPSKELQSSLKIINDSLLKKLGAKPFSSTSLKTAKNTIQEEWFRVSSTNNSNPHDVEDYLDYFESLSVPLLEYCVNLADKNGNTAMHYAVSHGNFDIVSILLDSKVCNVNQMNNAGYTSVMLVSLAKLKNAAHRIVVERLFQMADVNIRAKKHCQTALMLAVSHGNSDMVEMLLASGADINIQDEDGSTALMCAAEHGRVDIVKHLLSQQDCDSLIQDVDGSTAFKIAWQAGHRDLGLLLYVHEQMLRSKMPGGYESKARIPLLSARHKGPPTK